MWTSDHLQPWQDDEGHADFPWITLAPVGQRTRRLALGTGVTCPVYRHHPSDVAQAFATLTGLSAGRTVLGVGTGEAVNEQSGTGQFGRYPERHDRLVEAITLIRQLRSGRRVSFRGRYFRTEQLQLYNLPAAPPPIYVAASGPKSAALAGQYGDGWITGRREDHLELDDQHRPRRATRRSLRDASARRSGGVRHRDRAPRRLRRSAHPNAPMQSTVRTAKTIATGIVWSHTKIPVTKAQSRVAMTAIPACRRSALCPSRVRSSEVGPPNPGTGRLPMPSVSCVGPSVMTVGVPLSGRTCSARGRRGRDHGGRRRRNEDL